MLSVHINLGIYHNYLHIHEYAKISMIQNEHVNVFCFN